MCILRATYLAADEPAKRARLAAAGRELQAAVAIAAEREPNSPEYRQAMTRADAALNEAFKYMPFVEPLAPVFCAAAGRLRRVR